jgi:hypothetical protein
MDSTQEIINLLKQIIKNQEKPPFSFSGVFINFLVIALTIVGALTLQYAFQTSFNEIPLGSTSVLGTSWIAVVVLIPIIILLIWIFCKYLQPVLFRTWG